MKVTFGLTQSYRQVQLIQTGHHLPKEVTKELPMASLSPDTRKFIAIINPTLDTAFRLEIINTYEPEQSSYYNSKRTLWNASLDPQTPEECEILFAAFAQAVREREEQNKVVIHEELRTFIAKMQRDLSAESPIRYTDVTLDDQYKQFDEYDQARTLLSHLQERYAAMKAEQQRAKEEEERKHLQRKQQIEEERAAWIRDYGSLMLRAKVEDGYDCQRTYVLERAAQEHPQYTVDFDDKAGWETRSCPSDAAFQEAQRIGGRVVYLTAPASNGLPSSDEHDDDGYTHDDEYYPFKPCEAVIIHDYLGKYDLVREMR